MNLERRFLLLAAGFALLGVAAGAFGSHGLRGRVEPDLLAAFETGARYHMYHALALFGLSALVPRWRAPVLAWAGWLFVAGIGIFSGSLYLLALTGARWLGAVTPVGGVLFMGGWATLAWAAWSVQREAATPRRTTSERRIGTDTMGGTGPRRTSANPKETREDVWAS